MTENFIAEDAGEVTIIFCDICYFDEIIKDCKDKIIDILEDVFRAFDGMCRNMGVQKIETVGKTYMACAGLQFIERKLEPWQKQIPHTVRGFNFAVEVMNYANSYTYRAGKTLKMKVGIHYGNCIYGLLGYHKPQFSLIGDTVNTTSRHCTTGRPGCIILSEAAYSRLDEQTKDTMYFEEDKIFMKGKGEVVCYRINICGSQKSIRTNGHNRETLALNKSPEFDLNVHNSLGSHANLDSLINSKKPVNLKANFNKLMKQGTLASKLTVADGMKNIGQRVSDRKKVHSNQAMISFGQGVNRGVTINTPIKGNEFDDDDDKREEKNILEFENPNGRPIPQPNSPREEKEKSESSVSFEDFNERSDKSEELHNFTPDHNASWTFQKATKSSYCFKSGAMFGNLDNNGADPSGLDKAEKNPEDFINETEEHSIEINKSPNLFKKILSIFDTFPVNKKSIKEYYLYKMTSMYSKNFTIAVALAMALKGTNELLGYTSISNLSNIYAGNVLRVFVIFIYTLLLNRTFIQKRPVAIKIILMCCIILDFAIDVLDIHIINSRQQSPAYYLFTQTGRVLLTTHIKLDD